MRKVKLTKGEYALVDDEDFEFINQFKWCFNGGYAKRGVRISGKSTLICMHRIINMTPNGMHTDHINKNTLDNRKSNLRSVTAQQNLLGMNPKGDKSSKYKGVHLKKQTSSWCASITLGDKREHLGSFSNEIDAAKAYDAKAREIHKEYAYLNFPIMENKNAK